MIIFIDAVAFALILVTGIVCYKIYPSVDSIVFISMIIIGIIGEVIIIVLSLMKRKISDDLKCSECIWAEYILGPCFMAKGYMCRRKTFKPIFMGWNGKHSDRKKRAN